MGGCQGRDDDRTLAHDLAQGLGARPRAEDRGREDPDFGEAVPAVAAVPGLPDPPGDRLSRADLAPFGGTALCGPNHVRHKGGVSGDCGLGAGPPF